MEHTACTVTTATGLCGLPAVATFKGVLTGETFAECEAHAAPLTRREAEREATKAEARRFCRREACVEMALGRARVAHAPH